VWSIKNQTMSFLPVVGFGSGAYSEKLVTGTRQRLSGFTRTDAEVTAPYNGRAILGSAAASSGFAAAVNRGAAGRQFQRMICEEVGGRGLPAVLVVGGRSLPLTLSM
jgi:hypothetical protein